MKVSQMERELVREMNLLPVCLLEDQPWKGNVNKVGSPQNNLFHLKHTQIFSSIYWNIFQFFVQSNRILYLFCGQLQSLLHPEVFQQNSGEKIKILLKFSAAANICPIKQWMLTSISESHLVTCSMWMLIKQIQIQNSFIHLVTCSIWRSSRCCPE